ncbi:MAG: 1-phosphofructokinase family hexose kinase [Rhodobacteraceae bacterium]|nr:1-phosphofructokinase family hexose kinase [Paracoccaceae bacterium]
MPDILTVTLNPCVDYATSVAELEPGLKLRCAEPHIDPGGGGINVSRAIKLLGGRSAALVAIGGNNGARLLQLLTQEGIATVGFQGPGETRQSLSVSSTADAAQFRFVLPGPSWTKHDLRRALDTIDQATGRETLVVLSGSQPPGVAKTFPAILSDHLKDRQARLVVDTSGPALTSLIEDPHKALFVLRMDDEEAEGLAGRSLTTRADTAEFARSLVARGIARNVIVARGVDGSVLATPTTCWHAMPPRVDVVSPVGAGDSFVGAFTFALSRGDAPEDCLRLAVATAASAVTTQATRLCDPKLVQTLAPLCNPTRI